MIKSTKKLKTSEGDKKEIHARDMKRNGEIHICSERNKMKIVEDSRFLKAVSGDSVWQPQHSRRNWNVTHRPTLPKVWLMKWTMKTQEREIELLALMRVVGSVSLPVLYSCYYEC